ncbi:MAG: hypothetical protein LBK50_02435 [Candidatus Nomurabacteria bacterium]|jgi:beta-lactamase superfamily II metal-dependent hydrolase|nr:hypothetical protein [Candidatus Nomurabacteria bacterium]
MRKIVIFNVGGASCAFANINGTKILLDVGKSDNFNPITDFLEPVFDKNQYDKNENGRYSINQLIVSHPHRDHISAIPNFNDSFYPDLVTCPNDNDHSGNNEPVNKRDAINWDFFDLKDNEPLSTLRKMMEDRSLPLRPSIPPSSTDEQHIYWLHPKDVEEDPALTEESYPNNISLVNLLIVNGHHILFPGDIQKEGMKKLLETHLDLKIKLSKHRLCILIAPHHGLKSSFSTELFNTIKDHRTRCLNVISEKPNNPDEARDVDSRYASSDYCDGDNNLESSNGPGKNYQRKTFQGHICIDFANGSRPDIEIITDTNILIDRFTEY